MMIYTVFDNNSDINANATIAARTGHKAGYEACENFFKERGVVCHKYRVFRQDIKKPWYPRTLTNLFGEISSLGPFPWAFGLAN
jgi:hypothetical protein